MSNPWDATWRGQSPYCTGPGCPCEDMDPNKAHRLNYERKMTQLQALPPLGHMEDLATHMILGQMAFLAGEFAAGNVPPPAEIVERARSAAEDVMALGYAPALVRLTCKLADAAPWGKSPDWDALKSAVAEYRRTAL
jgi:hypothetical protein